MLYIHGTDDFELEKSCAVTLGKFDGVHRGHQKLMSIVKAKAKEEDLMAVSFTFDKIPLALCPQKNQHFITTNKERRLFLEQFGMDALVEYPFTKELLVTEPEDFVSKIIVDRLRAKYVVVGTDYRFGRGRGGDVNMLSRLGKQYGFETIIVDKEKLQDRVISSTYVREELKLGHMETVNMLLGRPFEVHGVVSNGKKLGRTLNIPTINIYPPASKLLPPNGVYASITIMDDKSFFGVTNIGTRPTVDDTNILSVETNLFDYCGDAYGNHVAVRLMHFLRPEMKFENVEMLKKQMEGDALFAKEMFMIEKM